MKKSYTLLITILLVTLFSYLSISILETKSLQNNNLQKQYLYIQAKNHKEFLKEYLKKLELKDINHLKIDDNIFNIEAFIEKKETNFIINIFIKAKNYNISIHEKFIK